MPIIKSAIKALRQSEKKYQRNKTTRSKTRSAIKKARTEVNPANISLAFSAMDKAVKKKVIKKNTANRLKSRLSKQLKPKS